jgi:multicomponent K+:H+ antiporter subunit E
MKRVLPAPLLSASLFALWLLLEPSLGVANLLLAATIAVAIPVLAAPLRPLPVRIRRPGVVLRLIMTVLHDVTVSNLLVARGVLRSPRRPPNAAFVRVPLDLRDANGLAALAVITTFVPGTVWSELALDRSALLLHVFEVGDEAEFVRHYKARYERPLMEIFE